MFTLVSMAGSASLHTTCYTHESFHERTAGFAFLIRAELVPITKSKQLQIKKKEKKGFKYYNHYIVSIEFLFNLMVLFYNGLTKIHP